MNIDLLKLKEILLTKENHPWRNVGRGIKYGDGSVKVGYNSVAEGNSSAPAGSYSHSEGNNTQANNNYEHSEGTFNKSNLGTIHSIGIGSSNKDRKNAIEVMSNGDSYVYGLGGYDGTNPESSRTLKQVIDEGGIGGGYSKPISGIPASDLADDVQASLAKADTSLQEHQDISGKANISDLAAVATSGSYNDLSNKPSIPTVPTNISSFTNDSGYLTSHQDISGKEDKSNKVTSLSASSTNDQYPSAKAVYDAISSSSGTVIEGGGEENIIEGIQVNGLDLTPDENKKVNISVPTSLSQLSDDSSHQTVTDTEKQTWNAKQDVIADLETIRSKASSALQEHQDISGKANSADLATVATSGSYNDLSDKPTIPTVPTNVSSFTNDAGYLTSHQSLSGKQDVIPDLVTIRNGASLGASAYQIPATGIPYKDLDAYIQASLDNSNTALQEHQDISGKEDKSNKVTSINGSSTNDEYPSARAVYNAISTAEGNIPTSLSQLSDDSLHKTVSDTEKQTWNSKQSFIADLDTIRDNAYLGSTAIQSHQDISGKQDVISDLGNIRTGAELGMTAVQPGTLSSYATKSEISSFITKSDVLEGANKIVVLTQAAYDAISSPDANTLYIIK